MAPNCDTNSLLLVGTEEARRPETGTGRREPARRLQTAENVTAQGGRMRLQDPEVWGSRWHQDGMKGIRRDGGKIMHYAN